MIQFKDYFLQQLQNRPNMPFVEFMHYALYAPYVGYYSAGSPLGKEGDFITAPELTPLFGYALANQCAEIFKNLTAPKILEFGAGSGKLCVHILQKLEEIGQLPDAYFILDVSASLKMQQQTYIKTHAPTLFERVQWLTQWPTEPFEGVLIANEVLDAMPVHRFLKTENGLFESFIGLKNDQFEEQFLECHNTYLIKHVDRVLTHITTPYASEVNLMLEDWIQQCAQVLTKGAMLIVDYGFPEHEYYHPDRNQGTLMCHSKHQSHTNPLTHPGLEDITAHVDFTHVALSAHEAGFDIAGYTNQAAFLLSNKILDFVISYEDRQAIRQLTHPSEMGELFKVIGLTKHLTEPMQGFQLFDKRASL